MAHYPLPAVTVELLTRPHTDALVGYDAASIQEVRRPHLTHSTGPRALVGPYHAFPAPNHPVDIALRAGTRALLVSVRNTLIDPHRNHVVPLVHAPGACLRIPLAIAPPPPNLLATLDAWFSRQRWVFAETYRGGLAEHWWSHIREWPDPLEFRFAVDAIARYGHRRRFGGSYWMQVDVGGFTYWTSWTLPKFILLINRRPITREPVPVDVDQELVVTDAERLHTAAHDSDPWIALAETLFR